MEKKVFLIFKGAAQTLKNMPQEDFEANWDKKRVFRKVLDHSKIIEARCFTKIKIDQEISNFRAFPTYGALNKIV